MPNRRMGQEELRQQAETVKSIDSKVSGVGETVSESADLIKKMWKLFPYFGVVWTIVVAIASFSIGAYKYDASIVKQPQLSRHEAREIIRDSILNAKIDTNYVRVNDRVEKLPSGSAVAIIHRRIDSLGRIVSLSRRGAVTSYRRPDGSVGFKEYPN